MRMSFVKAALVAGVLTAAMVAPAAAQSETSVGANLTFLREEGDPGETGAGFSVELARGIAPNVAVLGEFGLNSFDGATITSYLAGVRYLPAVEAAFRPFVQALIGAERFSPEGFDSESAFAFQLGGGVEVPLNDRVNFRAQYDYRRTSYDGEGFNGHRFGVGVVLPLGGN